MADTKKSEVVITCNAQQPKAAVRAMETELKRLQAAYKQLSDAGKAGTERAKQMAHEIKELSIAVKEGKANMDKIVTVTNNLSNSSLSQLQRALRQVKKEMGRVSTDSPKLDDLRQKYKAITDQIKILQGEMVNIQKHMGNLSQTSDAWLSRAINQQKQLVAQTDKNSNAYQRQVNVLHQLQAEQANRAFTTVSGGGANAESLRAARANLVSYRDQLGKGGIMPASGNVSAEIERINAELKKCDDQLDVIAGKEKQVELTTQQIQQQADKIILDPKKFSPKEIKAAIDDIQKKLDTLSTNDPARARLGQSMKQLQNILNGVDKELVDIGRLLQPGNLKKAPIETLQKAAAQLDNEIKKLNRDQQAYIDKKAQLAQIRAEINAATGAVKKHSSAWQTTLRNMSAYFGAFQMFSIAIRKLSQVFKDNFAFSDQLANIRKVSNLAMADINRLAEALAKIDTRTTIQELNEIAYAGAKLGMGNYGMEGLLQFTRAANVVNVALKEDLGEGALTELSKLVEVMGLIPKLGVEDSMLKAGSAIFKLGATSTATGTNIIQFSKRLMGLANQAGITTDQLLAIGSAADAMGLMPEVAATAFNKLITSIQRQPNLIEKALEIDKGRIAELFEAGRAMDAMVLIFDKMKAKGNMNALGNIWKDLGSDGARLISVMATMAQRVDMLKSHLEVSKQAFEEGTAVTQEYNIQQETAEALMERASNLWEKAFVNPNGVDMVHKMAEAWYDVSKSLTESNYWMAQMRFVINSLAVAFRVLLTLLPLLLNFMLAKGVVATWNGIVAVYRAFTMQTVAATAAQAALNKAIKANVWVAVAAAIVSVVVALVDYFSAASDAEQATKRLNDAIAEGQVEADKEIRKLNEYIRVMEDVNTTTDDRRKLLNKFKSEYGKYIDALGVEINTVTDLKNAYADLAREIRKAAFERVRDKFMEQELDPLMMEMVKKGQTLDQTKYHNVGFAQSYDAQKATEGFNAALRALNDQQLTAAERQKKLNTFIADYGEQLRAVGLDPTKGLTVADINGKKNDLSRRVGNSAISARGFQEYVLNMLDRGQVKNADEAYREIIRREFPNAEGLGGHFDEHNNYVIGSSRNGVSTLATRTDYGGNVMASGKFDQDFYDEIKDYVDAYFARKNREDEINAAFAPYVGNGISLVGSPGALENEARDKAEEARRKREEAARRKALRAEMREEQDKAKAIIDNVKNYYERQIAAITEMATRTGMDSELQKKLVDGMTVRMNSALANVRQAIAGTENEWADFRQSMLDDLYEPLSADGTNQSTQLLDNIIHNDIDQLKKMIETLSKELGQNGSVLLDQIWRKATENELANAKQANSAYQARQKVLLEKNYTGKVNRDYEGQMEQLGVAELTPSQSQQLMKWSQEGKSEDIQNFVDSRSQLWQQAFLKAREHIVDVFAADVSTEDGQKAMLTLLFGEDYNGTLSGSALESMLNMDLQQWQVFYQKLIEMSDAYTDAQKKAYDEAKRRADFVFNNRPDIQGIDKATQDLSTINSDQQRFGSDKNFTQQLGMSWNMDSDPEILRYRLLSERARLYYQEMKSLREQDKISEQQLTDAKRQMMEAQTAMADKVAAKFNERVQLLQSFSEPLATFAEGMGEYFESLNDDAVDSNQKLKNLLKEMILAYGKMMIQMAAQDMTRRVTKKLYQQQELADETTHRTEMLAIQEMFQQLMLASQVQFDATRLGQKTATDATELTGEGTKAGGLIPLGIAEGAAKIIGTLGFWGIPLIAVISALLMGLLSWALSAAFGSSDSGGGADTGPNVKLATGMLTYDAGNTQSVAGGSSKSYGGLATISGEGDAAPVLGTDGKVYNAKQVGKLQTGIVTQPIATMVNGQPSLVGEKGPEMVIGRETTAAMQMARPDLINEIVKFDKNFSGRGFRTYDDGNLSDFTVSDASAAGENMLTSDDIQGFRDTMAEFTAMMLLLQKNGLHVNKFGRGSVTQESADGAAFMRRNSGDRLWRKG